MTMEALNKEINIESTENIVETKKEAIINATKIETQKILTSTPLELLNSKKEIITAKALNYAETNNLELKEKLLSIYSVIYKQNPREAIEIRDTISNMMRKNTWDIKRNLAELTAGLYNNSISENSIFAA